MSKTSTVRDRVRFAALALGTIALGLLLQRFRAALPLILGDVLGDALWAMMIYWLAGAAVPHLPRWQRGAAALLICWGVELSQLYHGPWIDRWRNTTLGHLVLGTDFDPRDFLAYAFGALTALALESGLLPPAPTTTRPPQD